ncbi:MAG: LCP family protein, partial [Clostridia bacterium]|nr:LCP family protein [Clostridia bacterium]
MRKLLKISLITLSVILALAIAATGTFFVLNRMGKIQFHKNDKNIKNDSVVEDEDSIIYKNKRYKLNSDVISFLFIGIDRGNVNANMTTGLNGQADTILVAAINTKTKNVTVIPISRETLVDVNMYNISGGYSGVANKQVCLAYAYGKTTEECSENVLRSVGRILYGINISSYVTMDLNALEKLSNSMGYIEVYVNEDYYDSSSRTYYKAGQTIKVKGKSAVNYIHWRTNNVDANNYRM